MANTIDFILTNAASELISKVLSGKTLNFTRMAVGDGFSYDTTAAKEYTTLVNEVLSIDITKKETLSASSVKITSAFKNTDAQKEFYYREVGLYAQDPDTGEEILYAYGNRNEAAELITPTGSSVVTKQLIFVISVGDSANVTFNVNADVYALQEDMIEVQENKANKNLANTGMITNCLLEVPQRIKYTLENGKITIKTGTIIIVPYGKNEPTYSIGDYFFNDNYKIINYQYIDNKLYYWLEIQEELTAFNNQTSVNDKFYLTVYFNSSDNTTGLNAPRNSESGTNTVSTLTSTIYYHNSDNMVYSNNVSSTSFTGLFNSLPLAIGYSGGTYYYNSITEVFNGMGYIGSTVWVDKGVKGLIPNGRNPNGTLNNIEFVTSSLHMRDYSNLITDDTVYLCFTNYYNRAAMLDYKVARSTFWGGEKPLSGQWWFDPDRNYWYFVNADVDDPHPWLNFAKATFNNGVITSFIPNKPFNAIDKTSDRAWLTKLAMPSGKYVDYALDISGTNYIAPFNGWFAIRKVAGIATAGVSCAVYNATVTTEIYRQTIKNSVAEDEVAMIIPILQGQVLQVSYDATGETIYFRFIYAQGEVN